ncbi:MAG: PKD domain-containing protein [Candidatus Omnitrophota bacterium]
MKKIWMLVSVLLLVLVLNPGIVVAAGGDAQIKMGDLDKDGNVDVVYCIQSSDGPIRILINDGSGKFKDETAERLSDAAVSYAHDIDLKDIDSDGDLDIIGVREYRIIRGMMPPKNPPNNIKIWINDGAGKFTDEAAARLVRSLTTTSVELGDVDGDGDLDIIGLETDYLVSSQLIVSTTSTKLSNPTIIKIWINDGAGKFNNETAKRLSDDAVGYRHYFYDIELKDIDGDNDLDILAIKFRGIDSYLNDGAGYFTFKQDLLPQDPIARSAASPNKGSSPLTVQFSSEGSYDPDGGALTYHWDFGDGTTSEEANPAHKYDLDIMRAYQDEVPAPHNYRAVLTVTDDEGAQCSAEVTIEVYPQPEEQSYPPIAQASAAPNVGSSPLTVQFSSAGSYDPDGEALTYHWDFGDGAASEEANPTHVYEYKSEYDSRNEGLYVDGGSVNRYTTVLTVTDVEGKTGSAQTLVIVRKPGEVLTRPPRARASAAPNVGPAPLTVQFNSVDSYDPDGGALTYYWDFGDGESSEEANPVHTFAAGSLAAENYNVRLSVTDETGTVDNAVVIVVVRKPVPDDLLPVAHAGAVPKIGIAPLQVYFSSIGSADPDGGELSYAWDFGDGTTSEEANPAHTYTEAGDYNVKLVVTDDEGNQKEDTVQIKVNTSNRPPKAWVSAVPSVGPAPLTVQFSSAGSSDPEGGALTYHWDFGDGESSEEANPEHTFAAGSYFVKNYNVRLSVTDEMGAVDSVVVLVVVRKSVSHNLSPKARASAAPNVGPTPLTVRLSSAGSYDPDGGALTYHWDFGDGTTSDEANPTHVYEYCSEYDSRNEGLYVYGGSVNRYNAVLTVTDGEGKTGSAQTLVIVRKPVGNLDQPLNILRHWQGETSCSGEYWGKNIVIKTEAEWTPLWARGFDGNGEKIYDGPPAVDFETEMALYVSVVAPYPGSRSIRITKIVQTEVEIVVSVQITKLPRKGNTAAVLSYSYDAVVIAKSSLPVRFVVTGEQNVKGDDSI